MAITQRNLKAKVTQLLADEFGESGKVTPAGDQVIIVISRADYEQRHGEILQQIQRAIDKNCPVRSEHLFILVRDDAGIYENRVKIWKSVLSGAAKIKL